MNMEDVVDGTDNAHTHTGGWWWFRNIASWIVLFLMLAVLLAVVAIPRVTGAIPHTVLTSSMEPTYPPGSLIVVREVDPDELAVGTPITYQIASGKPEVVTHRIIAVRLNGRGERTFITQGDANTAADPNPVRPEQVRGEEWYSVPYMGYVNSWITGDQHRILLGVVVVGLFGYSVWMFASGYRDDRRKRLEAEVSP